jgi:tetratricopeptide (TPR) repeat protein
MIFFEKTYKHFIFNALCVVAPLSIITEKAGLFAQVSNQGSITRYTEDEIQLQDKFLAAMIQQQIGKMDGAAKLYQEVLEKNPKCDGCAFQLARIYTNTGNTMQAVEFAKKAVTLDVHNKWYKMMLAETYEKIGKDKDAADIYKSLAEESPFSGEYNEEVYYRWVYTLVRMGEPLKAIKVLDDLEKKTGISEEITIKKQTVYEAMGDNKKAAAELKKLADKYPQAIEYQHITADYFNKLGDKTTAQELYKRILKLDSNDSKAQLALSAQNKPTVGSGGDITYLNSLKDLFRKPDIKIDDKIKTFLPYVNKIAEGKDQALASTGLELSQIIEQAHPNDAKSYSLIGDMLYHNGKSVEALEKYKKCIQINKAIYSVWEQMMYVQDELGLYEDMLKTSEQATDLFPNQAMAFYFNGVSNEKKGKLSEAISSLEQAVLMSSKKPQIKMDALIELGVTYSKSKSYDKADKSFEEALKLNNKSSIALIKYANSLASRGATERAKPMADEALKISMESDPSVLELYGDYLFKSGDKDGGVKYWTKAKERGAKSIGLEKKIAEKNILE